MEHVDALPAEHLASPNVAIYELNHVPSRNATCDLSTSNSSSVLTRERLGILSTVPKLATFGDSRGSAGPKAPQHRQ